MSREIEGRGRFPVFCHDIYFAERRGEKMLEEESWLKMFWPCKVSRYQICDTAIIKADCQDYYHKSLASDSQDLTKDRTGFLEQKSGILWLKIALYTTFSAHVQSSKMYHIF